MYTAQDEGVEESKRWRHELDGSAPVMEDDIDPVHLSQ